MTLIVTPAQALARLADFSQAVVVDMVLVPPMADLAPQDRPARRGFGSTKAWLTAEYEALVAVGDRIDAHWRAQAAACGVEVLAASGRHYLHVRGTPAGLAALLAVPDLEEAYFLTEAEGACGADKTPWVYRRSKFEKDSLTGTDDRACDAPLGLMCAEGDLDRLAEFNASVQANLLRGARQDLQWADAELEHPSGHPRHAEYVCRVATARQRIDEALKARSLSPDTDD